MFEDLRAALLSCILFEAEFQPDGFFFGEFERDRVDSPPWIQAEFTATEEDMEPKKTRLSLDWWTVLVALALAALALGGLLPGIPW